MGKAPVRQEVLGSIAPGGGNKIYIRYRLRHRAQRHSTLTQLLAHKSLANAATNNYMCKGVHVVYNIQNPCYCAFFLACFLK